MDKHTAERLARETMERYNATAYVIIKYSPNAFEGFRNMGYNIDCGFVVFRTHDDLEKFARKELAYDYIDEYARLRDGDRIISAYSKDKIIIVV